MPYFDEIYTGEPDISKALHANSLLHRNISSLIKAIIENEHAMKAHGRGL